MVKPYPPGVFVKAARFHLGADVQADGQVVIQRNDDGHVHRAAGGVHPNRMGGGLHGAGIGALAPLHQVGIAARGARTAPCRGLGLRDTGIAGVCAFVGQRIGLVTRGASH